MYPVDFGLPGAFTKLWKVGLDHLTVVNAMLRFISWPYIWPGPSPSERSPVPLCRHLHILGLSGISPWASLVWPHHLSLQVEWDQVLDPLLSPSLWFWNSLKKKNVASDMCAQHGFRSACAQRRFESACASSLSAFRIVKDVTFLHEDNEVSDQTARMRRLIWVFVMRLCQ